MDDERFCTRCGENVANIPPEGTPAQSVSPAGPDNSFGRNEGYSSPANYSHPANNPYAYAQPMQNASDEMTLGKWVLTIIVTTFLGIISLIFLFIWGFGDGPESRKNYCKAMLIADLIGLGVGIIFSIIFFAVIGNVINNSISEYINRMRELGYDYSQIAAAFIG